MSYYREVIKMPFPREIRALHQIEITSRCQLRCHYCPSPDIVKGKYPNRAAVDMTQAHFSAALNWVEHFVVRGMQVAVNLAGIGESTLHPQFVEFVTEARAVVGPRVQLILATNGLIHDEDMVAKIAAQNLRVFVSLHRPEKAGLAITMYKKYDILDGVSMDPSVNANDWAGQVEWKDDGNRMGCQWMNDGKVFALADGRISRCCLDASGDGVIGHVQDPIGSFKTSPYALCGTCNQEINMPGYQQYETGSYVKKLRVVP